MVHQTIIPDETTVTLSFTIPQEYVGKEVEIVAFVKQQKLSDDISSAALPGKPFTRNAFTDWIQQAEQMPSITLEEAKVKWEKKRASLL